VVISRRGAQGREVARQIGTDHLMQMDWTVEAPQAKGPETTETVRGAHGCSTGHLIRNDGLTPWPTATPRAAWWTA
jgi:hypothetical protein